MKPLMANFELQKSSEKSTKCKDESVETYKVDKIRIIIKDSKKSPVTRMTKVNGETSDDN